MTLKAAIGCVLVGLTWLGARIQTARLNAVQHSASGIILSDHQHGIYNILWRCELRPSSRAELRADHGRVPYSAG
jgi:hypothetical protein